MSLSRVLRHADPALQQRQHLLDAAAQLQWPLQTAALPLGAGLLRFEWRFAGGRLQALRSTDDWARQHLPELPGLAWSAIDADTAAALFNRSAALGAFGIAQLDAVAPRFCLQLQVPVMHAATAAASDTGLPCLVTDAGPLWIEQLQLDTAPAPRSEGLTADLPLPITLQLGSCSLPAARLQGLGSGDVVLLDAAAGIARRGAHRLFSFHLYADSLLVNDIFDDFADPTTDADVGHPAALASASDAPAPAPAAALDLAALPVRLQVLLGEMPLTLAELGALRPGSTLALPDQAQRQVRLQVEGHCVAQGELVQVGDGLGIQIQQRWLQR